MESMLLKIQMEVSKNFKYMKTLSAEEFKKKYGQEGVDRFKTEKKSGLTPFGERLTQSAKSGLFKVKQGFSEAGQGKNPISSGMKIGAGLIETAFSPASAALQPVIEPTIGRAVNFGADKLSDIPAFQKFADSKVGQFTSDRVEDVQNFTTLAGTVGGGMKAPKVAQTVQQGIQNTATQTKQAVQTGLQKVTQPLKPKVLSPLEKQSQLIKDATPNYSKKLISEPPIKSPTGDMLPRVSEGGLIQGRTINPTALEMDAGRALSSVKEYPVSGTNLQKYQSIQPEITRQSKALYESLKNENILRPPQQIASVVKKSIRQTAEESLLLQKTDPVIKNYVRVLKNAIDKNDGTLAGELKVRQAMDAVYKNARGKAAFGSERASALDEIHSAARDALNADIIAHARSTDVKAALKLQWDLLRASDVLKLKAEMEAGNVIGRLQQKYPISSRFIKTGAKGTAAGIGLGTVIP